MKVLGPEGNVLWDLDRYDFFRAGEDLPSVHPSLQRVSRLNIKAGLFDVKKPSGQRAGSSAVSH